MGPGSFDTALLPDTGAHARPSWLAPFLATGVPLALAIRRHWAALQAEAGDDLGIGPLSAPVHLAGQNEDRFQRALTAQREAIGYQVLDVWIRGLPADDMRRAAWLNLDRFSTTWVSCWPSKDAYLTNAEFREVASFYFGLPSPACGPKRGERIGSSRDVLDAYGCRLTTAKLPGDGWRTQHDALKWRLAQDLGEMHARASTEVYGLFAGCLPPAARRQVDGMPRRQRQGIVPDFVVYAPWDGPEQPFLLELKTLHHGRTTYPASSSGAASRCAAVARRARALPGEYLSKARRLDSRLCGTPEGVVGPVERQLQQFGGLRGLVFGAWGEASSDCEVLLSHAAGVGAERHWRSMGSRDQPAAVGTLAWLLRRRWGMTALRENARLKLDRLEFVGRGAAAAICRRQAAAAGAAARARAGAVLDAVRGPRTRGLARR